MGKIKVEETADDDFMNSTKVNDSLRGIKSSNSLSADISGTRSGNIFIKKVKVERSIHSKAKKFTDAIKSTSSKIPSIFDVSLETSHNVLPIWS